MLRYQSSIPSLPSSPLAAGRLRQSDSFSSSAGGGGSRRGSDATTPLALAGRDELRRSMMTGTRRSRRETMDETAFGVFSGSIGGSFDRFPRRDSLQSLNTASATPLILPYRDSFNSYTPSASGESSDSESFYQDETPRERERKFREGEKGLLWCDENAEPDDFLHNPSTELDLLLDKQLRFTWTSFFNTFTLLVVIIVLVGLFGGWPIYRYVIEGGFPSTSTVSYNEGTGISGADIPSIDSPTLVDTDTPNSVKTRTGFDGDTYSLVFSDEFNLDGRTFWPGDDPYWEAVDLNYWETTDLEWYDPDAMITKDGSLEITLTEEVVHDLNFRSGMLQSWNKFCFTGGYLEVNVSLPGTPTAQGYWPGVWMEGNLGRAGYGATNDGVWPYSYDSCDVGTLPNQTWPNGTLPTAAKISGSSDYGGELSWLPGQRLSACTCEGEDHPGPNVGVGRGAPEIDILEAQIASDGAHGSASQSIQIAPFDSGYYYRNTTPYIEIYNTTNSVLNSWPGAIYQESLSVATVTDDTSYEGNGWTTFGVEYIPGADGSITWSINGTKSWMINANALGPNNETQVAQRLISNEPMSIVLNLAISEKFQTIEWAKVKFPGVFRIDYVRLYQKGTPNLGCDPADYPTSDYINRHMEAYTNPNYTTWATASAGVGNGNYSWPKNSLSAAGC